MQWQQSHWVGFCIGVFVLLVLDLLVFHRKHVEPSFKSSALWTVFWCLLAANFNLFIYAQAGEKAAIEFLTGYLVEWSLSMDNVFVFAVVFRYFKIPIRYQHRVLFWGILGAVLMRFIFIMVGTELIEHFSWAMSIFGVLLVYTGVKLITHQDGTLNPEESFIVRLAKKFLPVHPQMSYTKFFIRENGKWFVTPLFVILLVIEGTDVMFAIDSVPAIFGITRDPYIVFTSNIAAIMGLRSLYFLLAGVVDSFRYLNYGLAAILVFVGLKMNADYWIAQPGEHLLSPLMSLAVIATILTAAIGASLYAMETEKRRGK